MGKRKHKHSSNKDKQDYSELPQSTDEQDLNVEQEQTVEQNQIGQDGQNIEGESINNKEQPQEELNHADDYQKHADHRHHEKNFNHNQSRKFDKKKHHQQVFSRVSVDPSRHYRTPESRESWGPNVKGKKFRKEKGKKKRCPNAGVRIDGAVNSVRLD